MRWWWTVEERDEPFRGEEAVALREELGDLRPIGSVVDGHAHHVHAESAA